MEYLIKFNNSVIDDVNVQWNCYRIIRCTVKCIVCPVEMIVHKIYNRVNARKYLFTHFESTMIMSDVHLTIHVNLNCMYMNVAVN